MNRLTLRFTDRQAEAEYTKLKSGKISENIKIILYLLALIQFTSGIPAIISKNYLGFGMSLVVVVLMIIISLSGKRLNNYKQFLAMVVLVIYHCTRPYFLPQEFAISKGQILLRGYNFASLQLMVISRFPEWNQKLIGVIFSFLLRFLLTGFIDHSIFDPESVIRNILTCIFIAYVFYANDKTERQVFLSYYSSREKLAKFKQLVVNYLPQSIVILNPQTSKWIFVNKAFMNFFNDAGSDLILHDSSESILSTEQEKLKMHFGLLKIEKDSIREVGKIQPYRGLSDVEIFKDFLDEVASNRSIENKAICLSASCCINNSYNLFGVIVTKIKWDQEDAIAIVLNDITYQEKLLSLKISNENKDKILATVSHELRTPLNGIIGILDIAENKINQSEVIEYLDLCKDNAKLLLGLVNSILDIQQIKQGKLKLNIIKVNIRKVLNDIVRLFHFQCKQKEIYLNLKISKDVPEYVHTDENRLKQILINLVGNAIKFTSQGGITVGASQDKKRADCLKLWVSDTGIGIKEEDKGKLFKMYSKLKDGESVNENGVGLGLLISNALAMLLGGKKDEKGIEVESTFGKGTKFEFSILKSANIAFPSTKKSFSFDNNNFEDSLCYPEDTKEVELLETAQSKMAVHTFMRSINTSTQGPHLMLEKVLTQERSKSVDYTNYKNNQGEILVVDDNPFNLMVVENVLNGLGFSIKKCKSGMEAIEEVKANAKESQKFKMILMDCNMPIMDGYEATSILKKLMNEKEVYEIPIVALTASNASEDIKKCFECGMSDFLMKPLLVDDFKQVMKKLG